MTNLQQECARQREFAACPVFLQCWKPPLASASRAESLILHVPSKVDRSIIYRRARCACVPSSSTHFRLAGQTSSLRDRPQAAASGRQLMLPSGIRYSRALSWNKSEWGLAWMGKLPAAVSPDSMTQSVPSSTAFATSVASARVGRGFLIMLSSICVAVMTGFPLYTCTSNGQSCVTDTVHHHDHAGK